MARLAPVPVRVARGGVSARPLNFDPLAQGVAQMGAALSEVADKQQRAMDHAAGILFDQGRREAIASALDDAKAAAGSAGKGYAQTARKFYQERAAKVLAGLPEGVSTEARQRLEIEIESGASVVDGAAREYVLGAEKAFQIQAFETQRQSAQKAIFADPASYAREMAKLDETVQALTGSAFTPEQAMEVRRKLRSDAAETAAEGMVEQDADDIADEATGPKGALTRDLDPEAQMRVKRRLAAKRDAKRAQQDRDDRKAEKALDARRDQLEAEAFDKLSKGELTEADLAQVKGVISPSAFRTLSDAFRRGDGQDRPDVVKGLTDKIYGQGANAKDDIRAAHRDGKLSNATATRLYKENDGAQGGDLSPEAKSEVQFLRNAVTSSELMRPVIEPEDRAVMLREFEAFAREKPRTAKELREYSNTLLGVYRPEALTAKRPPDARTLPPLPKDPPPITGGGFTRPEPMNAKDIGAPPRAPAPAAPARPQAAPEKATIPPPAKPQSSLPAPAAFAKPPKQRTPEERQQVQRWIGLSKLREHGGDINKVKADPVYQRVIRDNAAAGQ